MDLNVLCTYCISTSAETVCTCVFPLVKLCGSQQCVSKHQSTGRFHYPQPVHAVNFITRENWNQYKDWFYELDKAQQRMSDVLQTLLQFEGEIASAFDQATAEIQSLKDKYLQRLQSFRAELDESIRKAVTETSQYGCYSDPPFTCALSRVIWKQAMERDNQQLYVARVVPPSIAKVRELVSVELTSAVHSMPEFVGRCRCGQLKLEGDYCSHSCMPKCQTCAQPIASSLWTRDVEPRFTTEVKVPVEYCSLPCFMQRFNRCGTCGQPVLSSIDDVCDACRIRQ